MYSHLLTKSLGKQLGELGLQLEHKASYGPFKFDLEACPKERPRARNVGQYARIYKPTKTRVFEETLRNHFIAKYRKFTPVDSPISLTAIFGLPAPKKYQKKLSDTPLIPKYTKPDVDNYLKSCQDALEGYLFTNDSRIINASASKFYCKEPFIWICVDEFES